MTEFDMKVETKISIEFTQTCSVSCVCVSR